MLRFNFLIRRSSTKADKRQRALVAKNGKKASLLKKRWERRRKGNAPLQECCQKGAWRHRGTVRNRKQTIAIGLPSTQEMGRTYRRSLTQEKPDHGKAIMSGAPA